MSALAYAGAQRRARVCARARQKKIAQRARLIL
jgi:hypothetical protein